MGEVEFGVGALAGVGVGRLGVKFDVGVVISEVSLMSSVSGCCVLGASVVGSTAFERCCCKRSVIKSVSFFNCVSALSISALCFSMLLSSEERKDADGWCSEIVGSGDSCRVG